VGRDAGHTARSCFVWPRQGGDVEKGLAELDKQANVMIDDLIWWTAALKTAREG
jgi:hypothetical protein